MRLFPIISGHGRVLWAQAGGALAMAALLAGCGDNYRPTITPVNGNGPAAQPLSYAVVVSSTGSPSSNGVVTIIDYSGDTITTEATIGPGPSAFTTDAFGSTGYTLNSDGTISNFAITASLQTKQVSFSSLSTSSQIVNLMQATQLWATDLDGNVVDLFTGSPAAFQKAVPVASSGASPTLPVFVAGASSPSGQREYAVSQNLSDTPAGAITCNNPANFASAPAGSATPIEISTQTADPVIAVGKCPVFGVQTPDQQRLFVLNRGDDTITVINTNKNTLDQCPVPLVAGACPAPYNTNQNGQPITFHPVLPLSLTAVNALNAVTPGSGNPPNGTAGMDAVAGPVYAEYNAATQQLIVADYDGGAISVIDVSLDQYGNDSTSFGTTYTIPVGSGNTPAPNPASVTVLYDGSKAYTANQNDDNGTGGGTVTVVNLSAHTVEKTIPVAGHPRTVVSTQNSEYSKIYVNSPDSPFITIIESTPTTTDEVDATILVEGLPIDIRTTTENGSTGGSDDTSRVPGYGQPCYLPGSGPIASLASCQTQ
ncbi:MAG: hypothetical protein WBP85_11020 [Terracidiphilus sp.]